MGGKKKGNHNNNKQNSGGKNNKKSEREMRSFHKRKRDRVKYGGERWCADNKKLTDQLLPLGLTIRDVAGDGNCLFRAIGDQLENNVNKYNEIRHAIVTYMENNRDSFEPFLDEDDDGTFEEYSRSMRENGTWGGNLEIQAASLLYKINIIIYQLDQPRWEVVNFADAKTRTIQLSYLDGDHYASVIPINAATAAAPHATTIPAHLTSSPGKTQKKEHYIEPPNDFEKIIIESSGVQDISVVRKALEEHEWDSDATIAYLMTISGINDDSSSVAGADFSEDQQVPSSFVSPSISPDESVDESHLHKLSNKIKHIPHHPHLPHHGHNKESRKERRKNKKNINSNINNNVSYTIQEPPANTQNAIREMGALSI